MRLSTFIKSNTYVDLLGYGGGPSGKVLAQCAFSPEYYRNQEWWHIVVIPSLGRWRQEVEEVKVTIGHIANLRQRNIYLNIYIIIFFHIYNI